MLFPPSSPPLLDRLPSADRDVLTPADEDDMLVGACCNKEAVVVRHEESIPVVCGWLSSALRSVKSVDP